MLTALAAGQDYAYPHNAVNCERCHSVPTNFGSSSMTVQRVGTLLEGKFVPASEGGLHHRNGESAQNFNSSKQITGDRVSLSLLGDGYIEAIDSRDIKQNDQQQRQTALAACGASLGT
jgi:hypothetical protein